VKRITWKINDFSMPFTKFHILKLERILKLSSVQELEMALITCKSELALKMIREELDNRKEKKDGS